MAVKKPVIKGKKPKLPPDYDVILPGMGYTKPTKNNPPKKIKKRLPDAPPIVPKKTKRLPDAPPIMPKKTKRLPDAPPKISKRGK